MCTEHCPQVLDKCGSHALLGLTVLKQDYGIQASVHSVQEGFTAQSSTLHQSLHLVTQDTTVPQVLTLNTSANVAHLASVLTSTQI